VQLSDLGWNEFFAQAFASHAEAGLVPARVVLEHKHTYVLMSESGELIGKVRGRMLRGAVRAELPAVGDWVAVKKRENSDDVSIQEVLPRRTKFSRRAAGERAEEQIIAANIDVLFLVSGLDVDFNPRRIERYLALARGGGAEAVVLLNKLDVCEQTGKCLELVREISGGAPVFAISAETGAGLDQLSPFIGARKTVALLGSSGVGKSTLVNRLIGEERQSVGEVKEDDGRGRHTTTRRELLRLPGGGLLIDTPGMRELQLWGSVLDGLNSSFPEILKLGEECRFTDCRHESEPGCRVRAALDAGALDPKRFASFLKLRGELEEISGGAARRGPIRIRGRRIRRG
jgi:ribosome biogenesis GTPase